MVVNSSTRYLLIIACSQRKLADDDLLLAIVSYNGGQFRSLRKAQREGYWLKNIDVLILSAKYGLIDAYKPIANYEHKMSKKRD
jgi:cytoplasmic iron level regulating protein YaaA (DUF328/UPF0246 family)